MRIRSPLPFLLAAGSWLLAVAFWFAVAIGWVLFALWVICLWLRLEKLPALRRRVASWARP